jgi:hypothetical protein
MAYITVSGSKITTTPASTRPLVEFAVLYELGVVEVFELNLLR